MMFSLKLLKEEFVDLFCSSLCFSALISAHKILEADDRPVKVLIAQLEFVRVTQTKNLFLVT